MASTSRLKWKFNYVELNFWKCSKLVPRNLFKIVIFQEIDEKFKLLFWNSFFSQITGKVDKDKYRLVFYGKDEKGVFSHDALRPYNEETKKMFVNEHALKRHEFELAVKQADDALMKEIEERKEELQGLNELELQQMMVVPVENILRSLALSSNMNFDQTLLLMTEFKARLLNSVTRQMIFKYPQLCETFIALRRFNPNGSEHQVSKQVEKIKSLAKEICQHFKVSLNYSTQTKKCLEA